MRTIQMTLDNQLVKEVDKLVKKIGSTRSEFTRIALRAALEKYKAGILEQKHRQGYLQKPITEEESSTWEDEQRWSDETW